MLYLSGRCILGLFFCSIGNIVPYKATPLRDRIAAEDVILYISNSCK